MEETQYWIVVNRSHAGPYTAQQLKAMGISPDTYAWHRGLTQWVAASEIPELAAVLWPLEPEAVAVETVTETVAEPVRLTPPAPPVRVAAPVAPAAAVQTAATGSADADAECPSGYLWWSIVVTALFSLPLGIIAIVFSCQVKKQWNDGDRKGACRSSERAYWCSIIGFVTGLMIMPFQILAMLL